MFVFCDVRDIDSKLDELHAVLKDVDYLNDVESKDEVSSALTDCFAKLNYMRHLTRVRN